MCCFLNSFFSSEVTLDRQNNDWIPVNKRKEKREGVGLEEKRRRGGWRIYVTVSRFPTELALN
jgi:hypothetical protein